MAARRKTTRRATKTRASADCDQSIYSGSQFLGSVVGRRGVFTAKNVDGNAIGKFADANEAMRAVSEAARKRSVNEARA